MTAPINVAPGFVRDFELYCARSNMDSSEAAELRDEIRRNYEAWGPVIRRQAAVYRWADERYGRGRLPSAAQCESFMASCGYYPDPSAFTHCALGVLMEKCAELAGVMPADLPPA